MQNLPAFFLALIALAATSCSSDPEDRKFFNSGWMKPEAGSDERMDTPQSLMPIKNEYDHPPSQGGLASPPSPPPAQADQ